MAVTNDFDCVSSVEDSTAFFSMQELRRLDLSTLLKAKVSVYYCTVINYDPLQLFRVNGPFP